MKFDDKQMLKAFENMKSTTTPKGMSFIEDQRDHFARKTWKLAWQAAPTRPELDAVAERLGRRLKLHRGMKTPAAELARRKRARGTFSRGWHKGGVKSTTTRITAKMYNNVEYAGAEEAKAQTAVRAANAIQSTFQKKLQATANKLMKDFKP